MYSRYFINGNCFYLKWLADGLISWSSFWSPDHRVYLVHRERIRFSSSIQAKGGKLCEHVNKLFRDFLEPFGGNSWEEQIIYRTDQINECHGGHKLTMLFSSLSKPGIGSFIFKFPILPFQPDHYLKCSRHIKLRG